MNLVIGDNMDRDLKSIELSEISPIESDEHHMISCICGIWKQKQKPSLDSWLPEAEEEGMKWVKTVKRYKRPATK